MSFTGKHLVYIRYEFNLATDLEIQDTGFWADIVPQEGSTVDPEFALGSAVDQAVTAWAQWTPSLFSTDITGHRVVGYYYGDQVETVQGREEAALTFSGGGGRMPPQCTVVLTTAAINPTDYTPHRARKTGRMYLPTVSSAVMDTDPWMDPTHQSNYLTKARAWWGSLTADIEVHAGGQEGNLDPCVVSRVDNTAYAWRYFRVGRVIDTQRRRRNALTENYMTHTVAP